MTDRTGPHDHEVRLDKTEARQGARGLPVAYVLGGGLFLAFIAFLILYFFWW